MTEDLQEKKLKYVELPSDVSSPNGVLKQAISSQFDVIDSSDPEFVLYTNFGYDFVKYPKAVRIFHTGECVVPNFNECDYAIGFDRINFGDRYCRVPLYYFYKDAYNTAKEKHLHAEEVFGEERSFCSFTVSNDSGQSERKEFFELLSQYKQVDSGGRYLNNIGGSVKDKFEFDKKHKFSIAFENCCHPGYVTEKIVEAFAAGCIPIYYGAPDVALDFNPEAFINCRDYDSFEDVVEKIKEIDANDELYLKMLKAPIFVQEPDFGLEEFINHILSQSKQEARRRPYNTWIKEYETRNKRLRRAEKLYYFKFKRFKNMIRRIKHRAL